MKGETVKVKTFTETGTDPFGGPTVSEKVVEVENVLFSPGATDDVFASNRPDGVRVLFTLHFPKTFSGSLKGAQVYVCGDWYDVIGDPKPYMEKNTPGDWWMAVEAGVVSG